MSVDHEVAFVQHNAVDPEIRGGSKHGQLACRSPWVFRSLDAREQMHDLISHPYKFGGLTVDAWLANMR